MSVFCTSCGATNSDTATICSRCGKRLEHTLPSGDVNESVNSAATQEEYILKPGTVLEGRYYIKRVIGEGGFGITYEAVNEKIDMTVAIKELYCREFVHRNVTESDHIKFTYAMAEESFERAKKRFLQEAKILSGFGDEGAIVRVIDYFEENETAYIVMNYLHGITLDKYLKKNGPMKWDILIDKIKPLIATLERIHNRGIIHRDISTSNIMVLENGTLCLLDFGAAKDILKKDNKTSVVFTKQGYTPIEQYAHNEKVGSWSDVYALSAVCYECLTGVCPPDSLQRSIFDEYKSLKEQRKDAPDRLDAILKKGLAVKAENRYANMGQLLKDMNDLAVNKQGKKSKRIAAVMLVIFILLSAGSIFLYKNYREEIIFRFKETESFCLARDENVSIEDYNKDVQKIDERIKRLVGEKPYILEEEDDILRGVVPLECLGEEDPREIIRDLISRPGEWTICGVEIDDKYIEDIAYSDQDSYELVIKLTEDMPKETQDTLASLCDDGAVLSVDSGYNNHLSLKGKMDSPLLYNWNVQEQWKDKNMRDLFLYNITHDTLAAGFSLYSQVKSNWEVRDSNTEFGERQCNVEELDENRVTLEYWTTSTETISEGETTDFIISLKNKLDILGIPYAIGRERHQKNRVTLCVNQKDYNKDLFFLILREKYDITIQDAWGQEISDSYPIQNLAMTKNQEGKNVITMDFKGYYSESEQVKKVKKATQKMEELNIDTYYLMIKDMRFLQGRLTSKDGEPEAIQDGVFCFDEINMDDRSMDDDYNVLVKLLEYCLSESNHINGYQVFTTQYTNGETIVATEPESSRETFLFDKSEETEIVDKLKGVSDEYKVVSYLDYEDGNMKLSLHLSSQIYAESVSDHSVLLQQIRLIMDTCGMDNGTIWSDIVIGIDNRYKEGYYAGKIMFGHSISDKDLYTRPYTISVIGHEEKEAKWLKEIYNEMKSDERFKDYLIEFSDYSDYYIY